MLRLPGYGASGAAIAVAGLMLTARFASAGVLQSFQQTGQIDLELVAAGGQGAIPPNGTFNLTQVNGPVVKSTFYAHDWNNGGAGIDLDFNGNSVATTGPFASDIALAASMYTYQWDVTPFVAGPGSYTYTVGPTTVGNLFAVPAMALAVVYQDPSGPTRQVTILEGAQQLGETGSETENFTFAGMLAGPTSVSVLTGFDDNSSSAGEQATYNGTFVGGPFDKALGLNATLTNGTATSLTGTNGLSVSTGSDHFGVVLSSAVVTVPGPPAGALDIP